jgi:hypothetical protein
VNGQLLNLSFGRCSSQLILRDNAGGAVVPLPWRYLSGAFRGRFNPKDGQLYVVGTFGWVTTAARDGSFQRVRYTGAKVHLPIAWSVLANGIRLSFTEPLDRAQAEDVENYFIEQWNYKYGAQYGSSDYSPSAPDKMGHDAVALKSAKLSSDGKSVLLEIQNLKPVMQIRIKYSLNAVDGTAVKGEVNGTINRVTQ